MISPETTQLVNINVHQSSCYFNKKCYNKAFVSTRAHNRLFPIASVSHTVLLLWAPKWLLTHSSKKSFHEQKFINSSCLHTQAGKCIFCGNYSCWWVLKILLMSTSSKITAELMKHHRSEPTAHKFSKTRNIYCIDKNTLAPIGNEHHTQNG